MVIIQLKHFFFILVLISISHTLSAADKNSAEKHFLLRLDRVERIIQNNSQLKILNKIKALKQENQELRSIIEELVYNQEKLKSRLHALNEDMDRRVLSLETTMLPTDAADIDPNLNQDQLLLQKNTTQKTDNTTELENNNTEQQLLEQNAYQTAFNELKALRYGKAENSLSNFLKQYPQSHYAELAQYWLAESSYAQRNFKQSIKNYTELLNKYPNNTKHAEANLKIAYCYYELGDQKTAKKQLSSLIKNYPNSTEAGQAKRLLKKLK
jgi:tol-pal system protein YbgF